MPSQTLTLKRSGGQLLLNIFSVILCPVPGGAVSEGAGARVFAAAEGSGQPTLSGAGAGAPPPAGAVAGTERAAQLRGRNNTSSLRLKI